MKYFVNVDRTLTANSETEALGALTANLTAGEAYDEDSEWADAGPELRYVEAPEECSQCASDEIVLRRVSVGGDDNCCAWVCDACGHAHLADTPFSELTLSMGGDQGGGDQGAEMKPDEQRADAELADRLTLPARVRVWYATDGNAVPRWEAGVLRAGKMGAQSGANGVGYVLDVDEAYGGGTRVFPLRERTVEFYTNEGEPIVGLDEFGAHFELTDD